MGRESQRRSRRSGIEFDAFEVAKVGNQHVPNDTDD
jgi:hypothetical protein